MQQRQQAMQQADPDPEDGPPLLSMPGKRPPEDVEREAREKALKEELEKKEKEELERQEKQRQEAEKRAAEADRDAGGGSVVVSTQAAVAPPGEAGQEEKREVRAITKVMTTQAVMQGARLDGEAGLPLSNEAQRLSDLAKDVEKSACHSSLRMSSAKPKEPMQLTWRDQTGEETRYRQPVYRPGR